MSRPAVRRRRRGQDRVAAGVAACVVALLAGCTGGASDAEEPSAGSAPPEFEATFDVESPLGLVAGDDQVWVLTSDERGASLSRIDHTGGSTDVARLPGVAHDMAPYRDGVVVTRIACDAEDCGETAVELVVLDGAGSTGAEAEFARERGGLERRYEGGGAGLIGVQDEIVWVETGGQLFGHDVTTGRTRVAEPAVPGGVTCVLPDGLYTLVVVDEEYVARELVIVAGAPDPVFDVEIRRLVDGAWAPVPDTRRGLTYREIPLATCLGGGVHAGLGFAPGPVWSPASGWVDRGPYVDPPDVATAPEPVAQGSAGQLFVLESAGVIRRWFAGPDGPMSAEALDVPADLFVQPYGPGVFLQFDTSPTVVAGCVQQPEARPAARCWLGSR